MSPDWIIAFAALVTLGVLIYQSVATKEAAQATALGVRLQYRPYFDLKDLRVKDSLRGNLPIDDPRQPPFRLSVSFKLYNASPAPATLTEITTAYRPYTKGSLENLDGTTGRILMTQESGFVTTTVTGDRVKTTISPGKGYQWPIFDNIALKKELRDEYFSHSGLVMEVKYILAFTDLLGNEYPQEIRRIVQTSPPRSYLFDGTPADNAESDEPTQEKHS